MIQSRRTVAGFSVLLVVMAFVTLFPLFLMLLNSVKSNLSVIANPLSLPHPVRWTNFPDAWNGGHLGPAMLTSLEIVAMTVLFTGSTVSLAAYSIARKKFRAWSIVGGYFLAVTTVPLTLLIFPLYEILVRLNLIGSPVVLALVYTALDTPFSIFLLRGYYLGVPIELEEAAHVDGASSFQIFSRIILPLVAPGVLTVMLIVSLGTWNEFLLALTFFQGVPIKTAIVQFYGFQGTYNTQWNLMMSAAVIIVLPMIILFLVLQRQFVDGLVVSGLKG